MPSKQRKPSAYEIALQQVQAERSPAEEEEKDSQTAEQKSVQPVKQTAIETTKQPNGQTVKQQDDQTAKQQRIKATFYLQPEDIIAIDQLQIERFRQTGKKPEKSQLVSEAIQVLMSQQNG